MFSFCVYKDKWVIILRMKWLPLQEYILNALCFQDVFPTVKVKPMSLGPSPWVFPCSLPILFSCRSHTTLLYLCLTLSPIPPLNIRILKSAPGFIYLQYTGFLLVLAVCRLRVQRPVHGHFVSWHLIGSECPGDWWSAWNRLPWQRPGSYPPRGPGMSPLRGPLSET